MYSKEIQKYLLRISYTLWKSTPKIIFQILITPNVSFWYCAWFKIHKNLLRTSCTPEENSRNIYSENHTLQTNRLRNLFSKTKWLRNLVFVTPKIIFHRESFRIRFFHLEIYFEFYIYIKTNYSECLGMTPKATIGLKNDSECFIFRRNLLRI